MTGISDAADLLLAKIKSEHSITLEKTSRYLERTLDELVSLGLIAKFETYAGLTCRLKDDVRKLDRVELDEPYIERRGVPELDVQSSEPIRFGIGTAVRNRETGKFVSVQIELPDGRTVRVNQYIQNVTVRGTAEFVNEAVPTMCRSDS